MLMQSGWADTQKLHKDRRVLVMMVLKVEGCVCFEVGFFLGGVLLFGLTLEAQYNKAGQDGSLHNRSFRWSLHIPVRATTPV